MHLGKGQLSWMGCLHDKQLKKPIVTSSSFTIANWKSVVIRGLQGSPNPRTLGQAVVHSPQASFCSRQWQDRGNPIAAIPPPLQKLRLVVELPQCLGTAAVGPLKCLGAIRIGDSTQECGEKCCVWQKRDSNLVAVVSRWFTYGDNSHKTQVRQCQTQKEYFVEYINVMEPFERSRRLFWCSLKSRNWSEWCPDSFQWEVCWY